MSLPEPVIAVLKGLSIWLIRWMPRWILRKKFNAKALVESLGVELDWPTAVKINLDTSDPTVRLYLRLVNLTPLDFLIEKIVVEIDVAKRKLIRIDFSESVMVPPFTAIPPYRWSAYSTMHDRKVYIERDIDTGRAAAMRTHLENTEDRYRDVTVKIWLSGQSQIGQFVSPQMEVTLPWAAVIR